MLQGKVKILFLLSRFLDGGIDTVLVGYLQRLAQNPRYQITLAIAIQMGNLEAFKSRIPENVELVYLVESEWLTKWRRKKIEKKLPVSIKLYDEFFLNPIRRYLIDSRLKQLAENHDLLVDFDAHFHSFVKNIKKPKIVFFHFCFSSILKNDSRKIAKMKKRLICYDKVVVISKAMLEEGYNLFPELTNKLIVIYNAQERKTLSELAQKNPNDERIKKEYILTVERLEESQKDVTAILKAFKLLREKYGRKEKLYIIGKGNSEMDLKQLADEIGIADEVEFLGFQSNPYPWIKESCLLVHNAKFEGLPTILIEGLMLNKLIVASDCPTGPREILNEGKAGVLVPVGDAEAMARAINKVLTEKDYSCQLKDGVHSYSDNFTFERTEQQFDFMVRQLVGLIV